MAENILARQHPGKNGTYQWLHLNAETQDIQQGELAQLAVAAANEPVILLVPTAEVLHLTISLPLSSSRQIKKALPYAIEDLLAEDVENYHLAWSKLTEGQIAVAAIELACLHRHQDACQAAGIRLGGIYSELLFIPCSADSASVLIEQNLATLHFKPYQGGTIAVSALPLVLDKLITGQLPPQSLTVWQADAQQPAINWPDNLSIESRLLASALALFAGHMPKKLELNLLSAHYALSQSGGQNWLPWLPSVAMLVLAAGLQWGYALFQHWQSETLLSKLDNSNQQLFRQTFPDLKRIVNIKAQAQQELATLRKNAGQRQDQGFLFLLYQTGATLSALPPAEAPELQGMDFANNILSLSLKAKDIAQLDAFKQKLQQNAALKADIRSTDSIDNYLLAHFDISQTTPP